MSTYNSIYNLNSEPFLNYFSAHELTGIEGNFEKVTYKKGQTIFDEGSTPVGLYYIESGRVKLHRLCSDGKEQIVRILKKGSFIGYRDLIADSRYGYSATVLENSDLYFIPKADFVELLQSDDRISKGFMQMICFDLMLAEKKMADLAYKPVRGRLADTLLSLTEVYEDNKNKISAISLSRDNLASLVGTVKETVIRLLAELKHDNIISIEGREIKIIDPDGLMAIQRMYE